MPSLPSTGRRALAAAGRWFCPGPAPQMRFSRRVALAVAIAALAVAITLGCAFSGLQWRAAESPSWDVGIFTELAKRYAAWQPPIVALKGEGFNLLGDHFHPILVLLGPVYAIWPSALTLLMLQAVLLGAASGVLAYRITRMLGPWPGSALGLAMGISWGFQYAALAQFHEVAFGVLILAAALSAYLRGAWTASAVWAGTLVFVKEDLGLTVLAFGLLLAARARKPIGLWLAAWGVAWYALATMVVLPALNPAGGWAYSSNTNVLSVFDPAAMPSKIATVIMLVGTGAVLCLRSPILLLVLPTLAWRFTSANPYHWGLQWHYSAILMPIVIAAAADAIVRTRAGSASRAWMARAARTAPALALAFAIVASAWTPYGRMLRPDDEFPAAAGDAARAAAAVVPTGATVEGNTGLINMLVDRTDYYWIGNAGNPAPDYFVLDQHSDIDAASWGTAAELAEQYHPGTSYELIYDEAGYMVAARLGPATP